jgi:hypothetical protein
MIIQHKACHDYHSKSYSKIRTKPESKLTSKTDQPTRQQNRQAKKKKNSRDKRSMHKRGSAHHSNNIHWVAIDRLIHHFHDATLIASTHSAIDPLPLSNKSALRHFNKFQTTAAQTIVIPYLIFCSQQANTTNNTNKMPAATSRPHRYINSESIPKTKCLIYYNCVRSQYKQSQTESRYNMHNILQLC